MTHLLKAPPATVEMEYTWIDNPEFGSRSTKIEVEVKYTPDTGDVEILKCWVLNIMQNCATDVSDLMINYFNLDGIVAKIDWAAIYNEKYKD